MAKLLGRQIVDFEKDGNRIEGVKLHLAEKNDMVLGMGVYTVFVGMNRPCYDVALNLEVNKDISIIFDRYGKPMDIKM